MSKLEYACLVFCFRNLPSSFEEVRAVVNYRKRFPVVVIASAGDVRLAVELMKLGVRDYLERPFNAEQLLAMIANCFVDCD